MLRKCAALLLCLLVVLVCPAQAKSRAPLVLAAASMQESLNAAADAWAAKGHKRPVLSFAATSALARQIEAGAPADLFISADEDWMDYVQNKGLLRPKTRVAFLTNALVIVAPATSKLRLSVERGFPLARALGNGRMALADPGSVPAGKYAKDALSTLGVWAQVQGRVIAAPNVRVALALVERGEAPLGIVYATDAKADPLVRVAGIFPGSSHRPIGYPIAVLARSDDPDAEPFRRFLLSGEAKAIFRRFGFGTR